MSNKNESELTTKMTEIRKEFPIDNDGIQSGEEANPAGVALNDVNGKIEALDNDVTDGDNVECPTNVVIGVDEPYKSSTGAVDSIETAKVPDDKGLENDILMQPTANDNKLKVDTVENKNGVTLTQQALCEHDDDNNEKTKACRVHKAEGKVIITEVDLEFVKPNLDERHVVKMNDFVSIEHKTELTQVTASALDINVTPPIYNSNNNDASHNTPAVKDKISESPATPIYDFTNEQNPIVNDTADSKMYDHGSGEASEILEQQCFDDVNMVGEDLCLNKKGLDSKFGICDEMTEPSVSPSQEKDEYTSNQVCHESSTAPIQDTNETIFNQIELPVEKDSDEKWAGSPETRIHSSQSVTTDQETEKDTLTLPTVNTEQSKKEGLDNESNKVSVFDADLVHNVVPLGDCNDNVLDIVADCNLSEETPEIKNNQNGSDHGMIDNRQRFDSGVALDVSFETSERKGVTNEENENSGVVQKAIENILEQGSCVTDLQYI